MERVKADGSGGSGRVSPASEAAVGDNKTATQQTAVSPDQQQQQQSSQQQQQQHSIDIPHHQDSTDEK